MRLILNSLLSLLPALTHVFSLRKQLCKKTLGGKKPFGAYPEPVQMILAILNLPV